MSKDFIPDKSNDIPEIEYKCPHCGAPLGKDKDFCHSCGKFLGASDKRYKPIDEGRARTIRWIIGITAIVVFLVIYFVVRRG